MDFTYIRNAHYGKIFPQVVCYFTLKESIQFKNYSYYNIMAKKNNKNPDFVAHM